MTQAVATKVDSAAEFEKPAEGPFVVEFYMVQGTGFQCMAYCDAKGVWHHALNHRELAGEIRVVE